MTREIRAYKHWSPDELECLADCFGVLTDKTLSRRLQRSEDAIAKAAWRKLGMHRWDNLYNAAEMAEALGIPHAGRIIRWFKRGWLRGRRSAIHKGPYQHWVFSYYGILRCLRQRPWLVDPNSMPVHYFRSVVRQQWRVNPWFTTGQVAHLLGVSIPTVLGYIHLGLLEAEKKPRRASLIWVIRRSAIDLFLGGKQKEKEVAKYG